MIALAFSGSLFATSDALGQSTPTAELKESAWLDSVKVVRNEEVKAQTATDEQTLSDLKSRSSDGKLDAKKAQQVQTDASNSAKASKSAYKMEKKAQKARKNADAQTKKAKHLKETSDKNQ